MKWELIQIQALHKVEVQNKVVVLGQALVEEQGLGLGGYFAFDRRGRVIVVVLKRFVLVGPISPFYFCYIEIRNR